MFVKLNVNGPSVTLEASFQIKDGQLHKQVLQINGLNARTLVKQEMFVGCIVRVISYTR